jgi:hypothetical protein
MDGIDLNDAGPQTGESDPNAEEFEAAPEPKPKTLSELADDLEKARLERADAERDLEANVALAKAKALAERDAYKAFNDAVASMKPKRKSPTPRAAKASPDAASAEKKPPKKANPKK